MKGEKYFKKAIVMGVICLLTLSSMPLVLSDNNDNENKSSTSADKQFTDCKITVIGKCNTVTGPLLWIFGVYCPLLFKKDFTISANGEENESLTIFVRSSNGDTGAYYSYENVQINMIGATGFLYWGAKSKLFDGKSILVRCKA
jgi:hypothetical protein